MVRRLILGFTCMALLGGALRGAVAWIEPAERAAACAWADRVCDQFSWAMMIVGFLGFGAMLRRERRLSASR